MPTAILERFFVYCWRELTVSDSAPWCCSCGTRNFSSCFDLLETAGPAARSSTGQGGLLVLAHSCKVWQFFCTTGSDNHVPNWFLNLSQSWWKSLQISCCFSGNQSSTNWSQVLAKQRLPCSQITWEISQALSSSPKMPTTRFSFLCTTWLIKKKLKVSSAMGKVIQAVDPANNSLSIKLEVKEERMKLELDSWDLSCQPPFNTSKLEVHFKNKVLKIKYNRQTHYTLITLIWLACSINTVTAPTFGQ